MSEHPPPNITPTKNMKLIPLSELFARCKEGGVSLSYNNLQTLRNNGVLSKPTRVYNYEGKAGRYSFYPAVDVTKILNEYKKKPNRKTKKSKQALHEQPKTIVCVRPEYAEQLLTATKALASIPVEYRDAVLEFTEVLFPNSEDRWKLSFVADTIHLAGVSK